MYVQDPIWSPALWKNKIGTNDEKSGLLEEIQKVQNKLARWLNGVNLKDKKRTSVLLKNIEMMSTNQLNAQQKILEMWNASNIENYPLKLNQKSCSPSKINTRSDTSSTLIETGFSNVLSQSKI